MKHSFTLNGTETTVDVEPSMPLLWVLRDELGLTGTKFGCGVSACGACTVQIDGKTVRSCVFPVQAAAGTDVLTIEGISSKGMHRVQQAWIEHQVPQCGYCQSGLIMAVINLLENDPSPSESKIEQLITNICRCGSYTAMRRAIASLLPGEGS